MPIYWHEDGSCDVFANVGNRRAHRRLKKGATTRQAKRIEAELRVGLARGRSPVIPGDPTLTHCLGLYVEHTAALRSPATAMHHAARIADWAALYKASEARAAADHITRELTGKYAPGTINRSLGTLSHGLKLAWRRGLTPADYSTLIQRLPENNARTTALTMSQVATLADHSSEQVRAAIWLSLLTGCRRGEICQLRQEDIGTDEITLPAGATKTFRTRTVPIIPAVRPWLKYVPLSINFEGLKTGFRRARIAAGMPNVQYRDLRRSCGTMLVQLGVPLHIIAAILGHSSVKVTERVYAHLAPRQVYEGLHRLEELHQNLRQTPKAARKKSVSP